MLFFLTYFTSLWVIHLSFEWKLLPLRDKGRVSTGVVPSNTQDAPWVGEVLPAIPVDNEPTVQAR